MNLNNGEIELLLENNKAKNIVSKLRPKSDGKVYNIVNKLGYEYTFVFIFSPTIKAVYPIVSSLLKDMELPQQIDKTSIVYLTISLIGILLNRPKKEYQEILEKVKEDGLYEAVPKLVKSIKGIKTIFSYISRKLGKFVNNFVEMFAYTSLLVPFAITFEDIIGKEDINASEILASFSDNGFNKVLVTSIGIGTFTAKEFVGDIIKGLKNFKSKGIERVKKVITKIKNIKFKEVFKKADNIDDDGDESYSETDKLNPIDRLFFENKSIKLIRYSEFVKNLN